MFPLKLSPAKPRPMLIAVLNLLLEYSPIRPFKKKAFLAADAPMYVMNRGVSSPMAFLIHSGFSGVVFALFNMDKWLLKVFLLSDSERLSGINSMPLLKSVDAYSLLPLFSQTVL